MTSIANRDRQPAGISTGGQFAVEPRTETGLALGPGGQDWLDDATSFEGLGAFVTLSTEQDYTDLDLDPEQVQAVFTALAHGQVPETGMTDFPGEGSGAEDAAWQDWADDARTFAGGAFVTVCNEDGTYTDFDLDGSQTRLMFLALARHDTKGQLAPASADQGAARP